MITSMLDNDLYKYSMQWAVLALYPEDTTEYRFTNRGLQRFNQTFLKVLQAKVNKMAELALTDEEYEWLHETIPFLPPQYLAYLKNYRYNPNEVSLSLTKDNDLDLRIRGKWHSTILWEVPLLALISETYFELIDTDWSIEGQLEKAAIKGKKLENSDCLFADFGTRRRRSMQVQETVLEGLKQAKTFVGTSNVKLAQVLGIKPIGTMAHEFIMGVSGLEGLRHANRHALDKWMKVYEARLGVALTDTFGSDAFFKDFDSLLAHSYDGIRHDSGNPIEFGEKAIAHYESLGIDPTTKTIVFSDGLSTETAIAIKEHFKKRIRISFGIGTFFTNDFKDSRALNIVIKMRSINGVEVIKLSDVPTKATGDSDAIRVAKWTFLGEPLG